MTAAYLFALVCLLCISAALRVNVGGSALNSAIVGDNPAYYSASGRTYTYQPKDKDLYNSHRWSTGPLIYSFAVRKGVEVSVKLRFRETYFKAAGKRVLSIRIGDTSNRDTMTLVTKSLDVWKAAGYSAIGVNYPPGESGFHKMVSKTGLFFIRIEGVVENAMLCGLDLYAKGTERAVSKSPPPKDNTGSNGSGTLDLGSWKALATTGFVQRRHEACSVYMNGKVYLLGGRRKNPVNVLNLATNTWSTKKTPPVEMHHVQCVAVPSKGAIYMVGAWYGGFPREKEHNRMHVYYPGSNTWGTKTTIPLPRRRGSCSAVLFGNFIYCVGGNRGGHGAHAQTLFEVDRYNINTDKWQALPNMPNGRDHATGALVGSRFCVLGGRDGGQSYPEFFAANILPVNCIDLNTNRWLPNKAKIPVGRSGTMATSLCDGKHAMVVGGEACTGPGWKGCKGFSRADYYNVYTDKFVGANFMSQSRHSSGAALQCECSGGRLKKRIYVPSGSGNLGGGPELTTTDIWTPNSQAKC